MGIEQIKPSVKPEHKYAVALGISGGGVCPLEGYSTEDGLEAGYKIWDSYAKEKGLSRPVPIKFVDKNKNVISYEESKGACIIDVGLVKKVRDDDLK